MTLIICKYSNEKFSISFIYICLCDGIGRHARLKTLSILGPGSSPGAGNISKLLIKLFINAMELVNHILSDQMIVIGL